MVTLRHVDAVRYTAETLILLHHNLLEWNDFVSWPKKQRWSEDADVFSWTTQHKSGTGRDFLLAVVIYLIVAISRIKNWAQLLKRKLTMDYESFLLVPRGIFSSLMYSIGLTEKSYLATTLYNFRHPKPVWKLTHCIIITLASVALPSQVSQQTQFCSRKAQQTCQLK